MWNRANKILRLVWLVFILQRSESLTVFFTVPLFTEFAILLLVCIVNSQQRLQAFSVCLHILVVNVDIIQLLLFLKNLLCSAYTYTQKAEACKHYSKTFLYSLTVCQSPQLFCESNVLFQSFWDSLWKLLILLPGNKLIGKLFHDWVMQQLCNNSPFHYICFKWKRWQQFIMKYSQAT